MMTGLFFMKQVIILILLSTTIHGCVQRTPTTGVLPGSAETITDPVMPYHYEMMHDTVVKLSPGIFPEGVKGVGIIEVFINKAQKIERYKMVYVKLRDKGALIYDYAADKERSQTRQLDTMFRAFVKGVKVNRINEGEPNDIERYNLVVKIE